MSELLQAIVIGCGQGAIYTLLALGFVMIYKATGVINLAHPALMVIGGLAAYQFTTVLGYPFFVGLAAAAVVGALVAVAVERVAIRPMLGKPVFTLAIITLGVDIVLRVFASRFIGSEPRVVTMPGATRQWHLFGAVVTQRTIVTILVTLVIFALLMMFFAYSRYGLAMRVTALDQEVALGQGIRVGTIFMMSWAMAGALAAIAGAFIGAGGAGVEQTTWVIAFKALPVIIIGGLESFSGAVVGGFAVGIVETLTATYQPYWATWLGTNFSLVVPYILMLVVLMVRPYGLFGVEKVERV